MPITRFLLAGAIDGLLGSLARAGAACAMTW